MHDPLISKSNHLIEATYHLTLAEQRILLLVIAGVDSRGPLEPGICHTITATDLADAYNVPRKQAYEILTSGVERLYERSVLIAIPGAKDYTITRWVSTATFLEGQGRVELYFAPGILPFLTQLTREFTRYQLRHIALMTSNYAIRLYELLIQWRGAGTREVELLWLRERFDLGRKYPNIRDFKTRILVPAIAQINAHSDLAVTWTQRKTGRAVTSLVFTFRDKPAAAPPRRTLARADLAAAARPGESWDDVKRRLFNEQK